MKPMKNIEVISKFLDKERAINHTRNLISEGEYLINYQTVIAKWDGDILLINDHKYSVTTTKHTNSLKRLYDNYRLVSWKEINY